MSALRTEPRLADPDGFYAALMDAHRNLDEAASRRLDACLVILLANHIGNEGILREAIALARAASLGGADERRGDRGAALATRAERP